MHALVRGATPSGLVGLQRRIGGQDGANLRPKMPPLMASFVVGADPNAHVDPVRHGGIDPVVRAVGDVGDTPVPVHCRAHAVVDSHLQIPTLSRRAHAASDPGTDPMSSRTWSLLTAHDQTVTLGSEARHRALPRPAWVRCRPQPVGPTSRSRSGRRGEVNLMTQAWRFQRAANLRRQLPRFSTKW